jgi:hypothetical protein
MNSLFQHSVASLTFVAALVFVLNPFDFWMPSEFQVFVAGGVAIIAAVYVGFVYRDEGRDEREIMLRGKAARYGYSAGIAVLILSIVFALSTGEHPDVWAITALAVMVLVRLFVRAKD